MHFSSLRAIIITSMILIGSWLISTEKIGSTDQKLIIIDTSLSMAVEDIRDGDDRISRLTLAISRAQDEIRGGRGEIALMSYAQYPSLLSPLSRDTQALISLVGSIRPIVVAGGSDLTSALDLAKGIYGSIPLSLSIYTDGGSTNTVLPSSLPRSWNVSIVGIGSVEGGRIPLGYNADGTKRYKYYSGSELVIPYEDEHMETLVDALDGSLSHVTDTQDTLTISRIDLRKYGYLIGLFLLFLGFFLHPYVRK